MRCVPNRSGAAALAAAMAFTSCGRAPAPPPATAGTPAAATTAPLEGTATHGDHNPHHDGVVLMRGELHYEVVLDASGRAHRVYFSDALREDLPASVASEVVLTIRHPAEERIAMRIDDTGESWIGSGRPVQSPPGASARVAFVVDHEPYFIDIPFTATTPTR